MQPISYLSSCCLPRHPSQRQPCRPSPRLLAAFLMTTTTTSCPSPAAHHAHSRHHLAVSYDDHHNLIWRRPPSIYTLRFSIFNPLRTYFVALYTKFGGGNGGLGSDHRATLTNFKIWVVILPPVEHSVASTPPPAAPGDRA